jgi:hypothetical protein
VTSFWPRNTRKKWATGEESLLSEKIPTMRKVFSGMLEKPFRQRRNHTLEFKQSGVRMGIENRLSLTEASHFLRPFLFQRKSGCHHGLSASLRKDSSHVCGHCLPKKHFGLSLNIRHVYRLARVRMSSAANL